MLRIALPNKGRLADQSRDLFAEAGLNVLANGERALVASLGDVFEALFVRAQDIPEFVADGAADAGVTGLDLIAESSRELVELTDLGFGQCRLAVAVREDASVCSVAEIPGGARVATVFPAVTSRFFAERLRADLEIVPMSGAAEVAPHLGIAEVIVDLVSTGSTLRVNGLREVETILTSTARLVTSPAVMAPNGNGEAGEKARALDDLVAALTSVLRARGQRYVMANVPRSKLEAIKTVLPGLNGPTVVDILNGGDQVAVHAVVPASAIYRKIAELKALGAQGILVTRIERLMP